MRSAPERYAEPATRTRRKPVACTIRVREPTSASPEQVLAATCDFSPAREEIWPNVSAKRLEVHELAEGFADATEGTMFLGVWWERMRYEWSPGRVIGTVIDANVYEPRVSGFDLVIEPDGSGGSVVEMGLNRVFTRSVKGRAASVVYRAGRERLFGSMLRDVLRAVEKRG